MLGLGKLSSLTDAACAECWGTGKPGRRGLGEGAEGHLGRPRVQAKGCLHWTRGAVTGRAGPGCDTCGFQAEAG